MLQESRGEPPKKLQKMVYKNLQAHMKNLCLDRWSLVYPHLTSPHLLFYLLHKYSHLTSPAPTRSKPSPHLTSPSLQPAPPIQSSHITSPAPT
ncbi:hypothetical protein Pcinc_037185 [Petrolisthes cinctipes]|uniref:Uncharacterized protein n=1 Tax=Petrolisthes cinctipes TaxID=88211 RepID=A0AAE1BT13_PETCI|nr:hypothetical protein Pcinc_037185 [Petrolisthes cinctipes]